jgi:hypothetical protein
MASVTKKEEEMNKTLYVGSIVGGSIASFLCYVAVIAADGGISGEEIAPVIVPLILIVTIAHLTFVYRSWSSIRGEHARMTPGKAVGLLFVPIFNVYWIFQVYGGFSTDYNNYIRQKGIAAAPLNRGLLVFNAVLLLFPIPVICWIVQMKTISRMCSAVNAVHEAAGSGLTSRRPQPAV